MEVNREFIAAILTVIGFSVHDTIVVFDRAGSNGRVGGFIITASSSDQGECEQDGGKGSAEHEVGG